MYFSRLLAIASVFATVCVPPSSHSSAAADEEGPLMRGGLLYTAPDSAAAGGMRGTVARPAGRLLAALSMPPHEPRYVYRGRIKDNGRGFRFDGLPIAIYDLVLVFEEEFYEGISLTGGKDTLTERDHESISRHIHGSIPFFDVKRIHRTEGVTGREGTARSILQELRTRPVDRTAPGTRIRSLKLAFSEDVNIGWQLVHTREILHQEVGTQFYQELLRHHYVPELGGIRIVNTIRDLGELDLRSTASPAP